MPPDQPTDAGERAAREFVESVTVIQPLDVELLREAMATVIGEYSGSAPAIAAEYNRLMQGKQTNAA